MRKITINLVTIICCVLFAIELKAQQNNPNSSFKIIIDTERITTGTSNDNQFSIIPGSNAIFTIYWNETDTVGELALAGNPTTHTYSTKGIKTILISGTDVSILNNLDLRNKLISVESWGSVGTQWLSMEGTFESCENLVINATDVPAFKVGASCKETFKGCTNFNEDLSGWNMSNVSNTDGMFYSAESFNQSLNSWDVSNVTTMESMFGFARSFNQPLNNWDVSNVTNMFGMFFSAESFNQSLSNWDVSNVTTMENMFESASLFDQDLSSWDVSNCTSMFFMLNQSALSITNYDLLLAAWSQLTLQSNVAFGTDAQFCDSAAERTSIINTFNWTISDGGQAPANVCSSLSNNSLNDSFIASISPNPTTGVVTISESVKLVAVYALDGKKIVEFNQTAVFDVSGLTKGVYLAKITSQDDSSIIKKLIKR